MRFLFSYLYKPMQSDAGEVQSAQNGGSGEPKRFVLELVDVMVFATEIGSSWCVLRRVLTSLEIQSHCSWPRQERIHVQCSG